MDVTRALRHSCFCVPHHTETRAISDKEAFLHYSCLKEDISNSFLSLHSHDYLNSLSKGRPTSPVKFRWRSVCDHFHRRREQNWGKVPHISRCWLENFYKIPCIRMQMTSQNLIRSDQWFYDGQTDRQTNEQTDKRRVKQPPIGEVSNQWRH